MSLDDNFLSNNRSGDEHDVDVEFEVGAESESTEDGESFAEKKRSKYLCLREALYDSAYCA